jgi:dCTP deaminase
MILTAAAIQAARESGDIVIDPFESGRLSPNAYDWRLGDQIRVCGGILDAAAVTSCQEHRIPAAGMILQPENLYLGLTWERTCSSRYAQLLNGSRDTGALGIWVHVSAPLGHVGHAIQWTLEIRVVRPVRVYPRMTFGKLVFLQVHGDHDSYQQRSAKYAATAGIGPSRLHEELTAPVQETSHDQHHHAAGRHRGRSAVRIARRQRRAPARPLRRLVRAAGRPGLHARPCR